MDPENAVIFTVGEKQHQTSSSLTNSLLWINRKWLKIQLTNQSILKARRPNCFQVKCKRQQIIFKQMMFVKLIMASCISKIFEKISKRTKCDIIKQSFRNQLQFCAAHMLSSGIAADSCQGDSGGPLACANPASSDTTVS